MLVILAIEYFFFYIGRNAYAIVLTDQPERTRCFFARKTESGDRFSVPYSIIKEIINNFFKERVCINFKVYDFVSYRKLFT